MQALRYGHERIAVYLLELNYDPNTSDNFGSTPLFDAKTVYMIELLIKNGADVNTVNVFGSTPLHIYYTSGFMEGVSYLLQNGADPSIINNKGMSVEMMAKEDGINLDEL